MLVSGGVGVIRLDDFIKEGGKGVEALVASSIDTDTGVGPFATGEDALLEGEAILVLSVLAGIPNVTSENLGKE